MKGLVALTLLIGNVIADLAAMWFLYGLWPRTVGLYLLFGGIKLFLTVLAIALTEDA